MNDEPADSALRDYYGARAPEYDDWYMRRGRYSHGPEADRTWADELAAAAAWLEALPIRGQIVELAAGTGWWSVRLARRGELHAYDAVEEPLRVLRARLADAGMTAHVERRDAWTLPDRQVDALFCGFWLSHVPRDRFADFLSICRRWLNPGGLFAFIDSRLDPQSSAGNHPTPENGRSIRRLNDGREFVIPKIFWSPDELIAALESAGFRDATVDQTARFFILGRAEAPS